MSLTEKRFEELVASLNPTPPRNSKDEKRQSSRVPVNTLVQIYPLHEGKKSAPMAVKIRDFSPRGVSIEFPRAIQRDEQFILHIPRREIVTALLCSVIHCRQLKGGNFSIGAEFTCTLEDPSTTHMTDKSELDRIRHSILD